PDIKSFTFKSFDFACTSTPKIANMNQSLKGDIDADFKPFSNELNLTILEKAIEESKSQVPVSDKEKEATIACASAMKCDS
ncbi:MAG: hypothetical protein ABI863_21500, partial [Ginsengibacter sp.]